MPFHAHIRLFALLLVLALTACSSTPKRTDKGFEGNTIKASSPEVQAQFDAALAKLEAGEWMAAREAFRVLQADHPNDPIAVVAELYIGRAGLQDLNWALHDAERPKLSAESMPVLTQLAGDKSVDARVRYAAQLYSAFVMLHGDDNDGALKSLKSYPSGSLSPTILDRDREPSAFLLAASLEANGRHVEAMHGWEQLYDRATDPTIELLAKSKAFESAAQIEDDELQEMTTDDTTFVRAIAGWEWVHRRLATTPDEDEREALEALHQRSARDLVAIGESARVAEHGAALAAWGPIRKLVLGAALPLSGPRATVGSKARDAMMIAQQSIAGGSDPHLTLVVLDSERPPEELFEAFSNAGVAAVIGPLDRDKTAAFAPHARAAGIPLLSLSPVALDEIEAAGEWVFRFFVDAVAEARAVARIAATEQGDSRAAIVYPDIGYGRTLATAFREVFEAEGGTIVVERAYDPAKTDYANVARAVASKKPDAIFLPGTPAKVSEVAAFLAQANIWGIAPDQRPSPKAQRIQVHYLGTSLWASPLVAQQAGSYVEGARIPVWHSPLFDDPAARAFYGRYRAGAGREPSSFEAVIADAVLMGRALMIERGVSRPEAFRDTIRSPHVYDGVTGRVGFGPDGEPIRTLRFLTVESGAFSPLPGSIETGRDASSDPVN